MSVTIRISCPKCKSDDCNRTSEELGELIVASVHKITIFCNHCAYTAVSLLVHSKVVCTEIRESGDEDTELLYIYLGKERG